jgi:hypothetical protein
MSQKELVDENKKLETPENTSKEEQIIETLKTSVIQFIKNEMIDLYKGDGYDTLEDTQTHVLEFFDRLGLVSICLDSNKAIIYCLNPFEFIDSKSLWTYCQEEIKKKHNYILCAALFKLDKETDFGVDAYNWTSPSLKKLWKR